MHTRADTCNRVHTQADTCGHAHTRADVCRHTHAHSGHSGASAPLLHVLPLLGLRACVQLPAPDDLLAEKGRQEGGHLVQGGWLVPLM